jgi:hypothetical protein
VLASLFIIIHTNFVLIMPIDFVNSIYDSTELPYKKLIGKSNNDNDDQSRGGRTREWRVLATANATTITNGLSNGDSDPTTSNGTATVEWRTLPSLQL